MTSRVSQSATPFTWNPTNQPRGLGCSITISDGPRPRLNARPNGGLDVRQEDPRNCFIISLSAICPHFADRLGPAHLPCPPDEPSRQSGVGGD